MPLLNYSTKISVHRTVGEIIELLVSKGAEEVKITYGATGQPIGLAWSMNTAHMGVKYFALPCNVDTVYERLTTQRVMVTSPQARMEQANRTAWRILKDWVEAQMALLETGMVQVEQIFLPYMLTEGQTLYQYLAAGHHRDLPPSRPPIIALPSGRG